MNGKKLGMVLTLVALVLTGVVFTSAYENQAQEGILLDLNVSLATDDYVVHDPIEIRYDADFEAQGWPGSGTAEDPYVIEGLWIPDGVYGYSCINVLYTKAHFIVRGCLLWGGEAGIHLTRVSNATIENNEILRFKYWGIKITGGVENTIRKNIVYSGAAGVQGAIYCWDIYGTVIQDNLCQVQYGQAIRTLYSCNTSIIGNNCSYNERGVGVYLQDSDNMTLSGNICNNNLYGILVRATEGRITRNSLILNNTCLNNVQVGLCLAEDGLLIRYSVIVNNTIGWNGEYNARDCGLFNQWDDGVAFGNLWGDYIDAETYPIYGSANSVDHYPRKADTTPPAIDSPDDLCYECGSSGNSITWTVVEEHPIEYLVVRNGTPVTLDESMGEVNVGVDGLGLGVYNFTLTVTDTCGNSASDTVLVTVLDTISPTLDHPNDLTYDEGSTGNSIAWNAQDGHPAGYEILMNGTSIESGSWSSSESISISIDGLGLGIYNYTIMVYDTSGNMGTDTVLVTVADLSSPTIDNPDDIQYEFGTTGNIITWSPSDLNPDSYEILRNGTLIGSGSWNGSGIEVSIDGLDSGTYNFTLVVSDIGDNIASDSVLVTVLPVPTTTTTETTGTGTTDGEATDDGSIMPVIAAVAIGVVCIIVIAIAIVLAERRRMRRKTE